MTSFPKCIWAVLTAPLSFSAGLTGEHHHHRGLLLVALRWVPGSSKNCTLISVNAEVFHHCGLSADRLDVFTSSLLVNHLARKLTVSAHCVELVCGPRAHSNKPNKNSGKGVQEKVLGGMSMI